MCQITRNVFINIINYFFKPFCLLSEAIDATSRSYAMVSEKLRQWQRGTEIDRDNRVFGHEGKKERERV